MKLTFKRITSSGSFIPEIDGLRFIAIASVIIMHASNYIFIKDITKYFDTFNFRSLELVLHHCNLGVPLFFVISGFVLGMPFAKYYINNEKPINLKKYFLRRLTRLEPPYILVLTMLFIGYVCILQIFPFNIGLKSYLASLIYSHDIIFSGVYFYPLLNKNFWSLEIEIQFYILAPIMAYVFSVNSTYLRRGTIIAVAFLLCVFNEYYSLPLLTLIKFFHYFLVGFLLADLYVSKSTLFSRTKFDFLIGFTFFIVIWLFETGDFQSAPAKAVWVMVQLSCIFLLYYYVIFHKALNFLSWRLITNIGGMCYSIYLLHTPIIYLFGKFVMRYSFSNYSIINYSIYLFLLILVILAISSIFFLLVERPCMDKDWYKKILNIQKKNKLNKS
jgi:peptidoglycan/LPS O-acetylase OafA/YrhL